MSGLGDGWGMKPAIGRHDLLKVSQLSSTCGSVSLKFYLSNTKYFTLLFIFIFVKLLGPDLFWIFRNNTFR
jgi:hypothetical protein